MRFAWAGISLGLVVALAAMVAGCPGGDANLCDPSVFPEGVHDPDYISHCVCGPMFPDGSDQAVYTLDCLDAGDGGEVADASADGPLASCVGQCVPDPPFGWDGPGLLWSGAGNETPPGCPDAALKLAYEGHADLRAPNDCGVCQCDAPSGACELPPTLTASSTPTCPGPDTGAVLTPFDPPMGWDGSCTSNDSVATGALCGGAPCVESLTIAPLVVTETGCMPQQPSVPTRGPATWGTFARACRGEAYGTCPTTDLHCSPRVEPGFRLCIFRYGDHACSDPTSAPYTEKHVFYDSFDDTRACSSCACDPPAGSICTAEVSIYPDGSCAATASYVATIDSTGSVCLDVITGTALGSKTAAPPVYIAGSCTPTGGDPIGSAAPVGASTFCCIPLQVGPPPG